MGFATALRRHAPRALAALLLTTAPAWGLAADAARGARLYLQLPSGITGCVACHGPDAAQGRNNLLNAAGRPQGLQRALNTVAAMGFL
jgi:mono/diheme cytochrome c family protein